MRSDRAHRSYLCVLCFCCLFGLPTLAPAAALQFLKTFDPVTSFLVKELNPNTEYVFQLAARSALGLGAPTSEVRERTLQSSRCPFSYPEFSEGITVRQETQRLGVQVWNGAQRGASGQAKLDTCLPQAAFAS